MVTLPARAIRTFTAGALALAGWLGFAQSNTTAQGRTAASNSQAGCERLAKIELPAASVTSAQLIAAGTFDGPPQAFTGHDLSSFYKSLPEFCRVAIEAKPTPDSDTKLEVWLPVSGWNGKLQGIGNGGFAGLIDYYQLGAAVSRGYVSTATDAGHTGSSPVDASWAPGHPEKVADFGYRAIHVTTQLAKAVVQSFYGKAPQRSYFSGCSDGGREALMEAQRYPADYDGILAGAPANYWTALLSEAVTDTQALTLDQASFIPPPKIAVISAAVLAKCDELDGVRDGILNDPRDCHFDPATIQCKEGESPEKCLTAAQVIALKKIYDGLHDVSGQPIFPGYPPGAEDAPGGWALWITGPMPTKSLLAFFGLAYFQNMVYEKPDWNYRTFSVDSGLRAAKDKTAAVLDAVDPDLKPLHDHGGKLILYHGWNDPAIPALSTIDYYQSVLKKMGQRSADSFVRLYMAPGVLHCGGGPGPGSFGAIADWRLNDPQHSLRVALEKWVEDKDAPSAIISTKYAGDAESPGARAVMTRPLCPYPQKAKYKGSGDTNDSASFVCTRGDK